MSGAKVVRPCSVSCSSDARALRPRFDDQPLLLEAGNHAADVARIEAEFPAQVGAGDRGSVRQFVEDAHLGQGEPAVEQVFLEHTDAARVEAIEATDAFGAVCERVRGHETAWLVALGTLLIASGN